MNTREKILTAVVVLLILTVVGLVGTIIAKTQEVSKYESILDVACNHSPYPQTCKAGLQMIKGVPSENIKSYGNFNF